jgi:hypothetical protein
MLVKLRGAISGTTLQDESRSFPTTLESRAAGFNPLLFYRTVPGSRSCFRVRGPYWNGVASPPFNGTIPVVGDALRLRYAAVWVMVQNPIVLAGMATVLGLNLWIWTLIGLGTGLWFSAVTYALWRAGRTSMEW